MRNEIPNMVLIGGSALLIIGIAVFIGSTKIRKWVKRPSDRSKKQQRIIDLFGILVSVLMIFFGGWLIVIFISGFF